MVILIHIVLLSLLFLGWGISINHKLAVMKEKSYYAMSQIGIQLSSCFYMLTELVEMSRAYEDQEYFSMTAIAKSNQPAIHGDSEADEVLRREKAIQEILNRIQRIAEDHPVLKSDGSYLRYREAVDCYKKMLAISYLIYNDSVYTLNRKIAGFPASLIARIMKIHQESYIIITAEE